MCAPTFTDNQQPMTFVMAAVPTKFSLPTWVITPEATATARGLTDYLSLTLIVRATRKKPMTTLTNFVMVKGMPDIQNWIGWMSRRWEPLKRMAKKKNQV